MQDETGNLFLGILLVKFAMDTLARLQGAENKETEEGERQT